MKKYLLLLAIPLLFCSCKKRTDTFAFKGTVVYYLECTGMVSSISEYDMGYIISLTTPDSIGADFSTNNNTTHHNCVILYHTRSRFQNGDVISGQMYIDNKYSQAYCNFHHQTGLPEAVCYSLD